MKNNHKSISRLKGVEVGVSVRFEAKGRCNINIKEIFDSILLLALEELRYPINFYTASIFACGLDTITNLNNQFLNNNNPTNVLSWPQVKFEKKNQSNYPNIPKEFFSLKEQIFLGDVAISHEYCKEEAVRLGVHFFEHFKRLATHSILHLLGFDHEDDKDAKIMEGLEMMLLSRATEVVGRNENKSLIDMWKN